VRSANYIYIYIYISESEYTSIYSDSTNADVHRKLHQNGFLQVFLVHRHSQIKLAYPSILKLSTNVWDITPYSPFNVNRRFAETRRLHLQCRRLSRVLFATCFQSGFFAWLVLRPKRWRRHVPLKCRLTFNGLHGGVSHRTYSMVLLTTTTARTSNLTYP
jgi:hypothetical protein